MDIRLRTQISVLAAGASSMAAQILFLREFLISFYGNEISVGMILAGWLLWGAAGSLVLGPAADIVKNKPRLLALAQAVLACIIPAVIVGIRLSKNAMGIPPGEIAGFYPLVAAALLLLAAPCMVLGFIFAAACRAHSVPEGEPSRSVARVYMVEAAGAIAGGAVTSYFLIPRLDALGIGFILMAVNLIAAMVVLGADPGRAFRRTSRAFASFLLAAVLLLFLSGGYGRLKAFTVSRLWEGFKVAASEDSVYGNVAVVEKGAQVSFYGNGLHLYTVPDRLSAESAVHFTLLEHPFPREVLLIGGGAGGLLDEALKHGVERIDYIELDPLIIDMSRRYLPKRYSRTLDDPRVRVINSDGRFYVKTTGERYDCVIVALGDPFTAQINRYYTVEFFSEAAKIMEPGGVLSFGLTASANYIGDELADYLSSIYSGLREAFPDTLLVPGDTMLFIASTREGTLTADADALMSRMSARKVDAQYVNQYYVFDTLSPERIEYATAAVRGAHVSARNTDLRPVSYFYATAFWSTQFDTPLLRRFLRGVSPGVIWMCAAVFVFIMLTGLIVPARGRDRRLALSSVAAAGFSGIVLQISVLLAFQSIYGYLFYKIGVIVTAFMAGLVLGSLSASRLMGRVPDRSLVRASQTGIAAAAFLLPPVFAALAATGDRWAGTAGAELLFPLMPVFYGSMVGLLFPAASRIVLGGSGEVGRVSGLTYGMDLGGACFGALMASAFLVPVMGIFQTCLIAGIVNLALLIAGLFPREGG